MVGINKGYLDLKEQYLFSEIAKRVADFKSANPGADIIRLGIGDVTLPLPNVAIKAMHEAVDDMSRSETFRGYGPEQGYDFFKEAIADYYAEKGVTLKSDEIFASDGAKSDLGNLLDILSRDSVVLVPDPVYPVYVDTNVMDSRRISYMDANAENGFCPLPNEDTEGDIIYLCSPNNPTGAVYTYDELKQWVDFANKNKALILFDAAYEAFVEDENLPTSIYQIKGAQTCAIEVCSFSKTAGFTGTRCGYTVVPQALTVEGVRLNNLWLRRQTTKFNGVSYITQRGAAAVFSKEGRAEIRSDIAYYKNNAKIITEALDRLGIWYCGGKNSPYVWLRCPGSMGSWDFFELLLRRANVVGTPGEGFGKCGEGYFRLTSFNNTENTLEAVRRIENLLK